jgi:endonuclease/exonuclease/phosphatase family metal-dependent hydrolase
VVVQYSILRDEKYAADRKDICESLVKTRSALGKIPEKRPDSLLLATWNIREFGGAKYGGRIDEAIFCIAEIINRFDLMAIQEVRPDLRVLERVMRLLGRDWERIYTDVSYAAGGNSERLAFIWNRSKVNFTGLAGELVLPPTKSKELSQIARTPFICGFQAGWARFNLCTVHIYYGTSKPNVPRRVEEIREIATLLSKKANDYVKPPKERKGYSPENLILLGDFNIFKKTDETFKALEAAKFTLPEQLMKDNLTGSNVARNMFYDQIVFYDKVAEIENVSAGIFDFYEHIFKDEDEARLRAVGKLKLEDKFRDWRTYQMSDHLVMWTEFKVDKSDVYLKELAGAV